MSIFQKTNLLLAGWEPWRCGLEKVLLPPEFDLFPEAERVLKLYGGAKLRGEGGVTVDIQPSECANLDLDLMKEFAKDLGEQIYPMGISHVGDTVGLFITPRGHTYLMFGAEVHPGGATFQDALVRWLGTSRWSERRIFKRIQDAGMTTWYRKADKSAL